MSRFDFKEATVKIIDGTTPTPNELEVILGEGSFTYTERSPRDYKKNRGKLQDVIPGDEEPLEVRFDAAWQFVRSDSGEPVSFRDALKKQGEASAWIGVETVSDCLDYSVNIEVEYTPPCSTSKIETITFPKFRVEEIAGNARDSMFNISGKCNVTEPTFARTAQS